MMYAPEANLLDSVRVGSLYPGARSMTYVHMRSSYMSTPDAVHIAAHEDFVGSASHAIVSGDGARGPRGFLTYPIAPEGKQKDGEIGYIATGTHEAFCSPLVFHAFRKIGYVARKNDVPEWFYVMNKRTLGWMVTVCDEDGRGLIDHALSIHEPNRIFGAPVLVNEAMPDIAPDAYAVALIAPNAYGAVVRGDPLKPEAIGGDVIDTDGIKLMKFGRH